MNIVVTERDKKLLRLVACLAIIVIFGMYLIRPAMENHETLQNEYDAAEQKQQEYQTQIAALATIDDIIAQNEAALNTASEKYYKSDLETRQMDDIITGIALENGLFPQSLTLTEAAPGAVSAYLAEQEAAQTDGSADTSSDAESADSTDDTSATLIFIFTIAAHMTEIQDHITEWRGLVSVGLHTLVMMGAVVLSSGDTGMAIQYLMIAVIMLFSAGLPLKWLGIAAGVGIASVPILWNYVLKDYQKTRILVLFDPSIDVEQSRQATYGKIAIGSGQFTGQGWTNGTMTQMQYVPENQTDYIFSVAGEELGFLGCLLIIILLMALIIRLFYVAYRASTPFSALIAVGVGGMLLFQTFMNIFMNVGLLPVMGLTLPFFSYGGTSIVTMFAALGIAAGVRMREKPSWLQN